MSLDEDYNPDPLKRTIKPFYKASEGKLAGKLLEIKLVVAEPDDKQRFFLWIKEVSSGQSYYGVIGREDLGRYQGVRSSELTPREQEEIKKAERREMAEIAEIARAFAQFSRDPNAGKGMEHSPYDCRRS